MVYCKEIFKKTMSVFDEALKKADDIANTVSKKLQEQTTGPHDAEGGLDWPLHQWYIERALFAIYGGLTLISVFLCFVFLKLSFLLIPMLLGIAQLAFAFLGIDIFVKLLIRFGVKQKQDL